MTDIAIRVENLGKRYRIGASLHFWPLHMHPYYCEKYGYQPDDLPVARRVGESILSLPLTPQMTQANAEDVVEAVGKVVEAYRVVR